jgi:hypothetical protein
MAKGILVFIENKEEKSFFDNLLKTDELPFFETHISLEAMKILWPNLWKATRDQVADSIQ